WTTDVVAHLIEPPTDVLGVPLANARGRRGSVGLLIAREGATGRSHIRVRPGVSVPTEFRREVFAKQPAVLRAERRVVDEHAPFVDPERGDLGHIWTAIIQDVKTSLHEAVSQGAVGEAEAAIV